MKICIISNLYEPYARGGAEQVVKNNITGLIRAGHEVVLITTKPFDVETGFKPIYTTTTETGFKPVSTIFNNFKTYRFYPLNIFYYLNDHKHTAPIRLIWHFLDMFNLHSYFVVKKILKNEKPDIVHTHNLKGIGYLIPKAIKSLKIKHIHTLHDIQLASPSGLMIKGEENNWQQNSLPVKLYTFICRKLFNQVDYVISPSKWLLSYYLEKKFFTNSQTIVLNNPIVVEPNTDNLPLKSNTDKLTLIYVGQIEKHKGIILLLESLKEMNDPKLSLFVVGEGTLLTNLTTKYKSDQIIFTGKLKHNNAMQKLSQADIFIMPTLCYENSPTVIAEALLLHKPVIASDIGGIGELLDPKSGVLFEAGDKTSLKNALNQAIESKKQNQFDFVLSDMKLQKSSLNNYIEEINRIYLLL
jgi:glycosyltransferase involved in cell wall biosynthesis